MQVQQHTQTELFVGTFYEWKRQHGNCAWETFSVVKKFLFGLCNVFFAFSFFFYLRQKIDSIIHHNHLGKIILFCVLQVKMWNFVLLMPKFMNLVNDASGCCNCTRDGWEKNCYVFKSKWLQISTNCNRHEVFQFYWDSLFWNEIS